MMVDPISNVWHPHMGRDLDTQTHKGEKALWTEAEIGVM